jgi:hypothetical protein
MQSPILLLDVWMDLQADSIHHTTPPIQTGYLCLKEADFVQVLIAWIVSTTTLAAASTGNRLQI